MVMTENEAAAGSLYRTVFDVLGEGVMVWGSNGRVLECNAAAAEIVGRPRAELIELDFDGIMRLGNLRPTAVRADGSAFGTQELPAVTVRRTGDPIRHQVVGFERPDGRFVWVETDVQPVRIGTGPPILVVSFRDVTAAREHQHALHFQAQLLAAVAQSVVAMDASGTVLYCNEAAARMYGCDPVESVGRPITTLMRATHTPEESREIWATLRAGEVWSGDTTIVTRHGATIPIFVNSTPMLGDDGRLVGIISVSTDITERTRAEAKTRALSAIVDWSADAIIGYQPDGTISSWNRGAERLFGWTADEVVGVHVSTLLPADRKQEFEHVFAAARTGLAVDRLITFRRHKSGEHLEVSLTISPVLDGDGRVVGISSIVRDVTEVMAARRTVERSESLLRALFQYSSDVAFILSPLGTVRWVSPSVTCLGYEPDDLLGRRALDSVHPDDRAAGRRAIAQAVRNGEPAVLEWRVRAADGEWRWVEAVITDLTQVESIGGVVANIRDITDRRVAEARRLEAEMRYRAGFDKAAVGLAVLDLDLCFTSVNAAMSRLLDATEERLLGRRATAFFHPLDIEWVRVDLERLGRGPAADQLEHEFRITRADGDVIWAIVDIALVRGADGNPAYYFMQLRDITDRKRAEAALEHRALHDELTELPNRLLLVDRLQQSLARAQHTRSKVAVIFADVDRFKVINDGLGHAVGDDLLVEVARRIESVLAPTDTIARFGGDEFVVVCEDVLEPADATAIAHRVLQAFDAPITVGGGLRYATLSIGVAVAEPGASAGQVLRNADTAMYRAKELGRARVEMFSEALQREVATRLDYETELRGAIDRDELSLLYQPIVELSDGHIVGVEALLRWRHRYRGLVAPNDFIPVAEETGMIVPIGTWALAEAMRDLAELRARCEHGRGLFVSVNLSVLQLRLHDVVRSVESAIRAAGLPPSALQLELTESALTTDDAMAHALEQMKRLGVQIAVDDFGTGYSSLSRLKQLPIDALKIDRSFVDGLPADPHDQSITRAVVALGRTLGLTVVAEGVETVEQWIALDEIGCQFGQGYFWSEPVPVDALVELLADDARLATGAE
jgi:diguanylate cyclase (GGDEF)-like protein/PAS domain S-box-containing protein